MRSLRGLTPSTINCVDLDKNIFNGVSSSGESMTVRQPRRKDAREHKKAWNKLSEHSKYNYRRKYVPDKLYDSKKLCNARYHLGEVPGFLPLIMEVKDRIVGFGDMLFFYGDKFPQHKLESTDIGCSMTLCVLDKYQGLGYGSYYTPISTYIAEHFNANYAIGNTLVNGIVYKRRVEQGWETVDILNNGYAIIRKRLI